MLRKQDQHCASCEGGAHTLCWALAGGGGGPVKSGEWTDVGRGTEVTGDCPGCVGARVWAATVLHNSDCNMFLISTVDFPLGSLRSKV